MTGVSDAATDARTRRVTRGAIVSATLDLIDQYGVQAATMRAIAARLGVRAQSLYVHIDSRDDLLDAVADRVVSEVDDDPDMPHAVDERWQLHLTAIGLAVRRYALRHPRAFVLIVTRPSRPLRPDAVLLTPRWMTIVRTNLERNGFSENEAVFASRAFDAFLLGSLLLETRDLAGHTTPAPLCKPRVNALPPDPAQNPVIDHQHDEEFTSALDNMIDRIATHRSHHQ